MAHPKLEPRLCENPDCYDGKRNRTIINPYNRNHRVCNKPECRAWLQDQSRRPKNKYKLTKKFIDNIKSGYELAILYNLTFTKDDIEKVEE